MYGQQGFSSVPQSSYDGMHGPGMIGPPGMMGPPMNHGPGMMGPPPGMMGPPMQNQMNPNQGNAINIDANTWGTKTQTITCPYCKSLVSTVVKLECNCKTCCCCFFGGLCIWCCCQSCHNKEIGCKDAEHSCPNCNKVIGKYDSNGCCSK